MGEEHIEPRDTPLYAGRPPAPDGVQAFPPASPERISPGPPPQAGKGPEPARKDVLPEAKDSVRELVETIVFVVVLVLLLKTFLAEAFVIPTGSMADTLFGYHREFKCEQCGIHFVRNASKEAEENARALGGTCPNCGFYNPVAEPMREVTGTLAKVDADRNRVTIEHDQGSLTLEIREDTAIRSGGRDVPITDLQRGMVVRSTYIVQGGRSLAQLIQVEKDAP